ncbi:hypothetical protein AGOR_G00006050 [Albula goreensis]|uniref:Pro-neuregulin-4, membrane-bound isoform n=1 Tax=Albula goreensis TaxID=1534307 RepID=A0A8T3EBA5_9TELE|nr:hypothetical protein AGOR_G00006050 [Albula goreensis]
MWTNCNCDITKLKAVYLNLSLDFAVVEIQESSLNSGFRRGNSIMMADHGEPCGPSEASYCLNGGTCIRIPSVSTPTCICHGNYKGSRCHELQLFSVSQDAGQAGLIAAVVIVVLLILVVLAVVIYCTYKMWERKARSTKGSDEYWKIKPRA